MILNLRVGDERCDRLCETAYAAFAGNALLDDRDERAGAKFADADLMGHPWQIIVGPRGAATGMVELKRREDGAPLGAALLRTRWHRFGDDLEMPTFEFEVLPGCHYLRCSMHSNVPSLRRYLRARRGERFVSVIAAFSLVGIALGVATLIIVMAVMSGFKDDLLSRILGLNGHLGVYANSSEGMTDYPDVTAKIRALPGVVSATPVIEGQVLLAGRGPEFRRPGARHHAGRFAENCLRSQEIFAPDRLTILPATTRLPWGLPSRSALAWKLGPR